MTTDLVALFDRCVSVDVQKALMRCVGGVYSEAYHQCHAEYPPEELVLIYPQVRWAKLEYSLRMLSSRFEGVTTAARPNGNVHHTELVAGKVVITTSAVQSPRAFPRDATYRRTLARSAQTAFNFMPVDVPHPDDPLYAFLLHGPDLDNPWRPAFIAVAFPDERCETYLDRVDLCARFPDIATMIWHPEGEIVTDDANPVPLPSVRSKQLGS